MSSTPFRPTLDTANKPVAQPATTPVPAPAPAVQPTQPLVNNVAQHLNTAANALSTQQQRNDVDTAEENARRAQQSQQNQQQRQDLIKAAARAQQSLNDARQQQIQIGDSVVIDLEKLTPEQQTMGLMQQKRILHQRAAHHMAGRVANIAMDTTGRVLTVETPQATYQVPEQLATRADLFEHQD